MQHWLSRISAISILLPAILGWIRFKKTDPSFHPFLFFIWSGTLTEAVGFIITRRGHHNLFVFNIYLIVSALLLLWLLKNLDISKANPLYNLSAAVYVVLWLVETFFFTRLFDGFNSMFQVFYSFTLVLMSVHLINSEIMKERISLTRNAIFVICAGNVLYNTVSILTETFYVYGIKFSLSFQISVITISSLVNIVTNMMFAFAIWWMPKRQAFTLQY
jgi:hypothetical protein